MLLAFDDNGPGPVVVLLHGFPLDRSMWKSQRVFGNLSSLAKSGLTRPQYCLMDGSRFTVRD